MRWAQLIAFVVSSTHKDKHSTPFLIFLIKKYGNL